MFCVVFLKDISMISKTKLALLYNVPNKITSGVYYLSEPPIDTEIHVKFCFSSSRRHGFGL